MPLIVLLRAFETTVGSGQVANAGKYALQKQFFVGLRLFDIASHLVPEYF
jgi:hypothetical protein